MLSMKPIDLKQTLRDLLCLTECDPAKKEAAKHVPKQMLQAAKCVE